MLNILAGIIESWSIRKSSYEDLAMKLMLIAGMFASFLGNLWLPDALLVAAYTFGGACIVVAIYQAWTKKPVTYRLASFVHPLNAALLYLPLVQYSFMNLLALKDAPVAEWGMYLAFLCIFSMAVRDKWIVKTENKMSGQITGKTVKPDASG